MERRGAHRRPRAAYVLPSIYFVARHSDPIGEESVQVPHIALLSHSVRVGVWVWVWVWVCVTFAWRPVHILMFRNLFLGRPHCKCFPYCFAFLSHSHSAYPGVGETPASALPSPYSLVPGPRSLILTCPPL